jgi:hypothetical protein
MRRRKYLATIGSLAAGGAAAMGTGAFTTATTGERSVAVTTEDDSDSFLAVFPSTAEEAASGPEPGKNANGRYASETGDPGTIELHFNEDARGTFPTGDGINEGSVYTFDDVFRIRNDSAVNGGPTGPTEVDIYLNASDGPAGVEFYAGDDPSNSIQGPSNAEARNSGQAGLQIGVKITEEGYSGDSASGTIKIVAEPEAGGQSG